MYRRCIIYRKIECGYWIYLYQNPKLETRVSYLLIEFFEWHDMRWCHKVVENVVEAHLGMTVLIETTRQWNYHPIQPLPSEYLQ